MLWDLAQALTALRRWWGEGEGRGEWETKEESEEDSGKEDGKKGLK